VNSLTLPAYYQNWQRIGRVVNCSQCRTKVLPCRLSRRCLFSAVDRTYYSRGSRHGSMRWIQPSTWHNCTGTTPFSRRIL